MRRTQRWGFRLAGPIAIVSVWLGSAGWADAAAIPSSRTAPGPLANPATAPRLPVSFFYDGSFTFDSQFSTLAGPYVSADDNRRTCAQYIAPGALRVNLKAAYTAEKAYLQEKDHYAQLNVVGFSPESHEERFCWKYVVTLAHRPDQHPASEFFVTAQPFRWSSLTPLPGPTLCISSFGGAHAAGESGISTAGSPITTAEACAGLPPSDGWRAPAPATINPGAIVQRRH